MLARMTALSLLVGLALALCTPSAAVAAQEAPMEAPGETDVPQAAVALPASVARDVVAALPADAAPVAWIALGDVAGPDAAAWPVWDDAAWETPAPWRHWAELVVEEHESPRPDPGRRAALALCAHAQGRDVDAWAHLAAARAEPGVVAALLPRLMPGTDASAAAAGVGGRPGALPDGVLLRPALPPLDEESAYGRPRVRSMTATGLRIGAATVDMELAVEADGVEIAFTHKGGGPARIRVALPIPHDREVRSLYVDWVRSETVPRVVELELPASTDGVEGEAAIWARFVPRRLAWPSPGELAAPRRLARDGIVLVRELDDPSAARIDRLAEALDAVLSFPARARTAAEARAPEDGAAPLVIEFPPDPGAALVTAKLAFLVSAAERFRLAR